MLDGKDNQTDYKVKCLDCDKDFAIPCDADIGEIHSCPGCGAEYEVKGKTKDKIDLHYFVFEDEDYGE